MVEGGYSSDEGVTPRVKPYSRRSSTAMSKEMSRGESQLDLRCNESEEKLTEPSGASGGLPKQASRRRSWLENAVADIKAMSFRSQSRRKSALTREASDKKKDGGASSSAADNSGDSFQTVNRDSSSRRKSSSHTGEKAHSHSHSHSEKLPVLRPLFVQQSSKASLESPLGSPSPTFVNNNGPGGNNNMRRSHSSLESPLPLKQSGSHENNYENREEAEIPSPALRQAITARRRRMSIPSAPIHDPVSGETIESTIVLESGDNVSPRTSRGTLGGDPKRQSGPGAAPSRLSADRPSAGMRRFDANASMGSIFSAAVEEENSKRENQVTRVLRMLDRVKGCDVGRVKKSRDKDQVQTLFSASETLSGPCQEPNDPVSDYD